MTDARMRDGERLTRFDLRPTGIDAPVCALSNRGALYCWGSRYPPVAAYRVECSGAEWVAWSTEWQLGCGVLSDGTPHCWSRPEDEPRPIEWFAAAYHASDLRDVAFAGDYACFRARNGRRDCVDMYRHGVRTYMPARGGTGSQFVTGGGYVCGSLDTCLWPYGDGFEGVECRGDLPDTLIAARSDGLLGVGADRRRVRLCHYLSRKISDVATFETDVVRLSSEWERTCVLLRDGEVQCWGKNRDVVEAGTNAYAYVDGASGFECGDTVVESPRSVPGGPFDDVMASNGRTCLIVRATGRALCFGERFESNSAAEFRTTCSGERVYVPW